MAHNQIQQIKFINKNKFLNFRRNECNELNKNLFICYCSYLINQKFIKNLLSNIIDIINNNNNSGSGSNSNNYNENQNECKSVNGAKHNYYYSNFLLDDKIDFSKSEYKYYKCNNCIMKKKDTCAIMMLNNNNYQSNYKKILLDDKNNSHRKQQSTTIYKKKFIYNQYKNLNNKSNINLSSKLMNLLVLFIIYISFISINLDTVNASSSSASSKRTDNFYSHHHHHHHLSQNEFSSHTIIRPQVHHGRYKRSITSTLEEDGLHAQHITFSFHHDGQKIVTDLYLNEDLIPHGHFLRYQSDTKNNGEKIIKNFTNKTDLDLCHYQGTIRGNPDSKVALSTCNGINGVIFDGHSTYFIYSGENGRISDDHYLFRHDDMIKNATCGFSNNGGLREIYNNNIHDDNNNDIYHRKNVDNDTDDIIPSSSMEINDIHNRILRYKRSIIDNTIRGPYNANKHSSFVELVIVVDNKVYKSFGENLKKVHNHCKDIANIVNALYVPLNIFIALVGVVVWNEANEIELSNDGDITLKNFLHYRRKILAQDHPNDNAQLLTKEQFNGGVVGKALKGPMCTYEYSGGVSMEHSQIVGVVATTVAHEMGHNFGMEHDTSECKCREEKCIMSASSTSIVPRYWSSCSVDQLNVAFSRGMNYCLRNKPTKLFDSPQCGNGFVEPGEQCDCGLPKYCENSCCNPNTCMLYANASCATGECCDLKTCHPKTAGTECRSAEGECDLPEYCTGESEYCPTDVYKRDTESCDNGNAFCFQGSCRSRSNQCKILWGPSGESSEHCYKKNIDGTRHGNCGYDRIAQKYMECDRDDVFCGMLHCRHLNERLEFGMESAAVLSHSFMNHEGSIIPCRTAIVDLGLQSTDPGLTPNGAKCGEGKMCVNQKCVKVDKLRAEGRGVECPENCNGQGICNSKGHCHCHVGFAPPFCNNPGSGGSEDSGPATNPNSHIGFTRAMYIFFLGVVPTVSIFLFLTYYWKQNRPLSSSTRKSATVLKTTMKSSAPSRGSSSPPGGMPTSSPSSTDDMNSALLRSPTESDTSLMNNSMFGKFKGFTLRPLPNATGATHIGAPNVAFVHPVTKSSDENNLSMTGAPLRVAPSPPKPPLSSITSIPDVVIQTDIKPSVVKQNGTLPNMMKSPSSPSSLLMQNHSSVTTAAPALPPPNPGFNARPIISSPILEASTCTAKELMSPLKNSSGNSIPIRPAPMAPPVPPHADFNLKLNQTSNSSGNVNNNERGFKDGTIKRIASFLRKDDNSSSQKHPQKVKPAIDREKLKNIEISAPIPVVDSSYDTEHLKNHQTVARTQSMRDNGTKKPIIQSFGSMRQSGNNRPKSMVGSRPKSPPPRPPAPPVLTNLKTSEVSSYQIPLESKKSATSQNEYDDCEAVEIPLAHISEENSPTGSDNIYSVIDECPPPVDSIDPSLQNITGSNDSMGLLGEIVSEIEKRNVDSIYSASTLKKKKSLDNSTSYSNTSESNDYSEGDYVKSNGSTTSSGYVRPSAINAPVARVAPTRPDQPPTTAFGSNLNANITGTSNSFSSFKPKPSMPLTATGNTTKTANTNSKPETKTISINKPITSVFNHGKVTTPTSAKVANNSDSMRKRSPSPIAQKSVSTVNRHRPTTAANNSVPGIIRKNSIGESKTITDTKRSSTVTNSNQSQKPKPLSKPALVGSKPITRAVSNSETSKLNRQNSDTTKPSLTITSTSSMLNKRTQSSTDQQQSASALNRKMSGPKSATTNSKSDDNSINNSSNVSSNSNNKNVIAASRPSASGGKLSNVASLQQKFENVATSQNTTTTTAGNSSKINSSTTAKK